ncbi:MAG: restriction endonuclease subunit S [Thermoguttaceae bacterium]|nr:restriction endonuclease subunit S [Thermoguttaceae bacterium]
MAREMKDSGVEWIGEIPKDWNCIPIKYVADFQPACDVSYLKEDSEITYIPMEYLKNGYYIQNTAILGRIAPSLTPFSEGDIAVAKVTPCFENGNIAIMENLVSGFGMGSSELFVYRPREINTRFLFYWLQNDLFKQAACATMTGTAGLKRVSPYFAKNSKMTVPSKEEQQRIADFLDAKCARINEITEKTRASIEEYKKLKQAMITEAVTKGIRPGRKMKDSGIEWIGEIPEDWATTKLKYMATIRSGITLGKVYPPGTKLYEFPYLRVANVQGGHVKLDSIATIRVTKEEAEKYRLHDGELLMTEGGDRDKLGRGTVWHSEIDPCLHQNHIFALKTAPAKLLAEYVEYLSISLVGRDYFDVTANQSVHLASTNSTTILNFTIPYPPLEEQKDIIAFLNIKCTAIDQLIDQKTALITELGAYKKSLIYEYVTGKKEVPAA